MILVDANLLIYAVNRDAVHVKASATMAASRAGGTVQVGLPWVCILAFLRVTTHPNVFSNFLELHWGQSERWTTSTLGSPSPLSMPSGRARPLGRASQPASNDGHVRESHIRCSCRRADNRTWSDGLLRGPRLQALPGCPPCQPARTSRRGWRSTMIPLGVTH